jgi:hypothetical protein
MLVRKAASNKIGGCNADIFMARLTDWLMGAMSNEPRRLAYLTGFYKGLQSAGSAITFRIDAQKTPFMVSYEAIAILKH